MTHAPELLTSALRRSEAIGRRETVEWLSPTTAHAFKEYRDNAALKLAGLTPPEPLADFWPARGPVWDAIGVTSNGVSLFVEAKAHIAEAASTGTRAGDLSRTKILNALTSARKFYAPRASAEWSGLFFQYANRLAHHYFLTQRSGLKSRLIFLYFLNADDVDGPTSQAEWSGASRLIHAALGLPDDLSRFGVYDAYVDSRLLNDAR